MDVLWKKENLSKNVTNYASGFSRFIIGIKTKCCIQTKSNISGQDVFSSRISCDLVKRCNKCLIVCLLPSRAQTRLWPSVWRPTTASTTWWRPPPKPWGSGWMSSWRAPKATRSSWAEGPAGDAFGGRCSPSRPGAPTDRWTFKEMDDLQESRCLQANEGFGTAQVPSPIRLSVKMDLREFYQVKYIQLQEYQ